MKRPLILALLLLLSSCLANRGLGTESAAQVNIYRLQKICLGMSEEEVFQIMRFPDIDEQILTSEACYDVWFYITRKTALGQSALLSRNLTPLIFKDGVLVAKGYDYYNYLLDKQKKSPPISMSSKPTDKTKKPAPKKGEKDGDEGNDGPYRWSEEDDRMIEQGQEQNFDYW